MPRLTFRFPERICLLPFLLGMAAVSGPAWSGEFSPPVIQVDIASRVLEALAEYEGPPPKSIGDSDYEHIENNVAGLWNDLAGANVGSALASASQISRIDTFSVSGEAEVEASLQSSVHSGDAEGLASVGLAFQMPASTPFTLTASWEFEGQVAGVWSSGEVFMSGIDAVGSFQHTAESNDPETWTTTFSGTMTAGVTGQLTVFVHAVRIKNPDFGINQTGVVTGKLSFSLDFGDRDRDGLLDAWEEADQIDLGDGAVIDLSEFDPDPDRKDVFVELDILHNVEGINPETDVIPMVQESFANAPAGAVENYDDSPGVNLHVLVDEDLSGGPISSMTLTQSDPPNGPWQLPPDYYNIKADHLGTETIRSHDLWDQGPLREAWLFVFRYALWVDRVQEPDGNCSKDLEACSPGPFRQFGGIAEGRPSNDFTVAAGQYACRYSSLELATVEDTKAALAAGFMHELGHTLGLHHAGGFTSVPNLKPNYLSVMNYAYSSVIPPQPPENPEDPVEVDPRHAFLLDYSRSPLQSLNENALNESDGLNGPLECRQPLRPGGTSCKILFNSASSLAPKATLTLANASSPAIDWNNDGEISMEPLDPPRDITRFQYKDGEACGGAETPVSYDVLTSHSDWDMIHWPPPQDTFEPGMRTPNGSEPPIELDQYLFYSLYEADWVDQTVNTDASLFKDGFETE